MHTELMLGIVKEQAAERYAAAERRRLVRMARASRADRSTSAGQAERPAPLRIRRHPVRVLVALAGGRGVVRR